MDTDTNNRMLDDFAILARVAFSPRVVPHYYGSGMRCPMRFDGEDGMFCCCLWFVGCDKSSTGDVILAVIQFLDDRRDRCWVDRKFKLCNGKAEFASGIIELIATR